MSLPSRWLPRILSLFMVGAGALTLMADSAECPDGYGAASYSATYHSDCPRFVLDEGTLRIVLPAGARADEVLTADLRRAGIEATNASVNAHHSGDDVCTPTGARFDLGAGNEASYVCSSSLAFDKAEQVISCKKSNSRTSSLPVVLRLGRRELGDASLAHDADTADAAEDGAYDGGDRDDADPATGSQPPSEAETCSITFTTLP